MTVTTTMATEWPARYSRWQIRLHWLTLLGVLALARGGKQWSLLGFAVPGFVTPDRATGKALEEIHEARAEAGYVLIGLHAGAALMHHYERHDSALLGMLPARERASRRRGQVS